MMPSHCSTSRAQAMNRRATFAAVALVLLALPGGTAAFGQTTTTKEAADAAKRQGRTGSSNENAAKQLSNLDKEQAAPPRPTPTATPPKK